jgi:Domain of unknown function (DUF4440)
MSSPSPARRSRAASVALLAAAFWSCALLAHPAVAQRPEPPIPDTASGTPAPPAGVAPAVPPVYRAGGPAAEVQAAEKKRLEATVAGDPDLLGRLLGDDLVYTHASGAVDGKESLLAALRSGRLRYLALDPVGEPAVRVLGDGVAMISGRASYRVRNNGQDLAFNGRFLAVYARRHGSWLLVAYQSTRLPQP